MLGELTDLALRGDPRSETRRDATRAQHAADRRPQRTDARQHTTHVAVRTERHRRAERHTKSCSCARPRDAGLTNQVLLQVATCTLHRAPTTGHFVSSNWGYAADTLRRLLAGVGRARNSARITRRTTASSGSAASDIARRNV